MRKPVAVTLAGLTILALAFGCTATQKGAGIGAGVGGVVGGVIGHQTGHTAGGVLIGAAVGALAGYVVGDIIEDRKVKTAEETARDYGYTSEDAPHLDLRSVRISPISTSPGGKVTTTTTLAVVGPADYEADIIETTKLGDGENYRVLQDKVSAGAHRSGTYEISRSLTIPKDAAPGEYELVKSFTCAGCDIQTATTSFIVTRS